jgi:CDP-6-deoxy-D-xylo-4-hexulose-3-dehydrase
MSVNTRDNLKITDSIHSLVNQYCENNFKFTFDKNNPIVRLHEPTFGALEINAALDVLFSTYVTMGKKVRSFEEQYAKEFGHKYGVMSNSGSSANLLAVGALCNFTTRDKLNAGDEVLVPALSWATTIWPLVQYNLVPVFVDCDPKTYNFDLNKLEAAISPKTRAIKLVHVYGNPCNMDGLMAIAKKHNLIVIEDSCESMGAYYKNKAVGTFGRIASFSFYFSHHITTLEGGISVTDDFDLAETIKVMRAHGWSREADEHKKYAEMYKDIDPRFIFINTGYNLRPTELQAAMGQFQIPKLAGLVKNRRAVVHAYQQRFEKWKDIFDFQEEEKDSYSSWFGFGFVVKPNAKFNVKDITSYLQANKIETRPIIAGNMAAHPAFKQINYRISGNLDNSNNIMKNGFAIGCHHALTIDTVDYVDSVIELFLKTKGY